MTDTSTDRHGSRQSEAAILDRVTAELRRALETGDSERLGTALADIATLWSVFVAEALNDANPLPAELRSSIAAVGRQVIAEINGKNPSAVDIEFVIDINSTILSGLTAAPAAATGS